MPKTRDTLHLIFDVNRRVRLHYVLLKNKWRDYVRWVGWRKLLDRLVREMELRESFYYLRYDLRQVRTHPIY